MGKATKISTVVKPYFGETASKIVSQIEKDNLGDDKLEIETGDLEIVREFIDGNESIYIANGVITARFTDGQKTIWGNYRKAVNPDG